MYDVIKKAVNSNLAKPLDTLITEKSIETNTNGRTIIWQNIYLFE